VSLLRRGFITWCENAARGYRRELRLQPFDALNPRQLASNFKVRIWKPSEVPGLSETSLKQLTQTDPRSWSAATVCVGDKHVIITNDTHSNERQNNSIMHELSHIILKHKPAQVFVSNTGQMMLNVYDNTHEEEANCLSGTLLVPRDALLHLLGEGYDHVRAAAHFVVTVDVIKMRVNKTGVGKQLASRRPYRSA
jgi:Zn-dependent peptidase ImmA (M78 family)